MDCEKCYEILTSIHFGNSEDALELIRQDPSHLLHDYHGSPLELQICFLSHSSEIIKLAYEETGLQSKFDSYNALQIAIQNTNLPQDGLYFLIEKFGWDIKTEDDMTLLHIACNWRHDNTKNIRLLLENTQLGLYDLDNLDWTPVHLAFLEGNIANVKLLISKGVNIYHQARFNLWPAICACAGTLDVVQYLVESLGVDMSRQNMQHNRMNYAEWNGLHYAAEAGKEDICRYLSKYVDVTVTTYQNSNCAVIAWNGNMGTLKFFHEECGLSLDGLNRFGENGAFAAVRNGQIELLKYLHNRGVNIFAKNKMEQIPEDQMESENAKKIKKFYSSVRQDNWDARKRLILLKSKMKNFC